MLVFTTLMVLPALAGAVMLWGAVKVIETLPAPKRKKGRKRKKRRCRA